MSQEKMEIAGGVRRLGAAFNKRDWDGFFAELDPEVEYAPIEVHGSRRGREALTEYLEQWLEAWETFSAEAEEIEIAAEDRAFIAWRFRGRGKGSGVEIDDPMFWVGELRGGRLYRISEYTDRAEALEAVGLRE